MRDSVSTTPPPMPIPALTIAPVPRPRRSSTEVSRYALRRRAPAALTCSARATSGVLFSPSSSFRPSSPPWPTWHPWPRPAAASTVRALAARASSPANPPDWVSEFAPKSKQRFLSYMAGWTSALGWQCSLASAAFLAAGMIQGLLVLNVDGYSAERWHVTLFLVGICLVATFFNTFLAQHLPLLEGLILLLHILGFFAIIIPLWVLAPKVSSHQVFTHFTNSGGWMNAASSMCIGHLAILYCFLGPDCVAHMCTCFSSVGRRLAHVYSRGNSRRVAHRAAHHAGHGRLERRAGVCGRHHVCLLHHRPRGRAQVQHQLSLHLRLLRCHQFQGRHVGHDQHSHRSHVMLLYRRLGYRVASGVCLCARRRPALPRIFQQGVFPAFPAPLRSLVRCRPLASTSRSTPFSSL